MHPSSQAKKELQINAANKVMIVLLQNDETATKPFLVGYSNVLKSVE